MSEENKDINKEAQELLNSVKEDKKDEAKDYLQKALGILDGVDMQKAEPPKTDEKPAPDAVKNQDTSSSDDEPYDFSDDDDDLETSQLDSPTVEDVESGSISADEFLKKSLVRIQLVEKSNMRLAKGMELLIKELEKSDKRNEENSKAMTEKLEKSNFALIEANKALIKSSRNVEKHLFGENFNVTGEPKMAGKEDTVEKAKETNPADIDLAKGKTRELAPGEKDILMKAYCTDRVINEDEFKKAKLTGILPESLKK